VNSTQCDSEASSVPREPIGTPDSPMRTPPTLGELFRGLIDDTRVLFRQEVRLARAEMMEKTRAVGHQSASIAIGGALALAGTIALIGAVCAGVWSLLMIAEIDPRVAPWLSPLIVGAASVGLGYALIRGGLRRVRSLTALPERTTQSLKETARWMQNKVA
jgi:hypothetical protein